MDTGRIAVVGVLMLTLGFGAGCFLGPRPPNWSNYWEAQAGQIQKQNDLLRKKVALLEAQLAEINAVLADGK